MRDLGQGANFRVIIDGFMLNSRDIEKLAVADGFKNSEEFFEFFSAYKMPFHGDIFDFEVVA